MANHKLVVYSDFICPFCYIGKVNTERLLEKNPDLEIEWRLFELHPEGQPDPKSPYMQEAQTSLNRLAKIYHINMKTEVLTTVTSESRKAMIGLEFAKKNGKSNEYHNAVFKAYWVKGLDIGNTDVLVTIASSIGLDPMGFRRSIEQETYLPQVHKEIEEARIHGVMGVPTYIYGDHMSMGAQPPEILNRLIHTVDAQENKESEQNELVQGPACGPEGCIIQRKS
jgi:Predicted dithiol-disulfide isomerase involved in polyketide biosynthesis